MKAKYVGITLLVVFFAIIIYYLMNTSIDIKINSKSGFRGGGGGGGGRGAFTTSATNTLAQTDPADY
jgi:uncharacterized membrane protein YgcG